jgi:hypothetical protein
VKRLTLRVLRQPALLQLHPWKSASSLVQQRRADDKEMKEEKDEREELKFEIFTALESSDSRY